MQTSQRNQQVSFGKGAGNHKDRVAHFVHIRHPGADGMEGRIQVAACPVGEFQCDHGLGAVIDVVLGNKLQCQFSEFDGVHQISLYLGVISAGQGNVTRQDSKPGLVGRYGQSALGILQVNLARFGIPGV